MEAIGGLRAANTVRYSPNSVRRGAKIASIKVGRRRAKSAGDPFLENGPCSGLASGRKLAAGIGFGLAPKSRSVSFPLPASPAF